APELVEELDAALRAQAAKDKVDTTPRSCGGASPLAKGEQPRRITSGDLVKMFQHHAEEGKKLQSA
ncbi:MAG: hypothetical protein CMK83_01700, partial [Pseudomonadales bacterium]|nr:hypothetical protein [Pseudomonadales bacterium]